MALQATLWQGRGCIEVVGMGTLQAAGSICCMQVHSSLKEVEGTSAKLQLD